jgi:hypothetical protein
MLIYALLPVGLLFHSSLYVFLSLHTRSFDICADLPYGHMKKFLSA